MTLLLRGLKLKQRQFIKTVSKQFWFQFSADSFIQRGGSEGAGLDTDGRKRKGIAGWMLADWTMLDWKMTDKTLAD